jgi:hypothetical protein
MGIETGELDDIVKALLARERSSSTHSTKRASHGHRGATTSFRLRRACTRGKPATYNIACSSSTTAAGDRGPDPTSWKGSRSPYRAPDKKSAQEWITASGVFRWIEVPDDEARHWLER